MNPTQQAVSDALAALDEPGDFAAERKIPWRGLEVGVRGVGRLPFPISKEIARTLCASALLAKYGHRDRTLLDTTVRDCWEIEKSSVVLDRRAWQRALSPELSCLKERLGMQFSGELRAELHNLLVYAPGQFFRTHQDSEKGEAMVGTLIVTLPSAFSGGAIVVRHRGQERVFRGSRKELGLIAFYADCDHEVRPVQQGYRIVLTFTLHARATGRVETPPLAPAIRDALGKRVRRFFDEAPPPRWPGAPPNQPPDRLVYLLDHEYSQHSLGWQRLKRGDALRAAALLEVARDLDCEAALVLADVHENWNCEEEETSWRYRRRSSWRDEDDEDGSSSGATDDDHPALLSLNESTVELRHWIGTDGKSQPATDYAQSDEVCFTTPSEELRPFRSVHEGYMGNWGNTVDRWYHRAALVLWPRERTFVIRAKASAAWAIEAILAELEAERVDGARSLIRRAQPFWPNIARRDSDDRLFAKALRVAAAIDDAELALALVAPFRVERLGRKTAPLLSAAVERYGSRWGARLVEAWGSDDRGYGYEPPDQRNTWLAALPGALEPLQSSGKASAAVARALVHRQWPWLEASYELACRFPPTQGRKLRARLDGPLLGVLSSALLCRDSTLAKRITRSLTSGTFPVLSLVETLRRAEKFRDPSSALTSALEPVRAHCIRELETLVKAPPRARDDWSIAAPSGCTCELCRELARFLSAPDRVRLDWPLAKHGRAHVHGIIDRNELPVTHVTRRSGRPYTLVLEKTRALFEREASDRAAWQATLKWLRGGSGTKDDA